MVELKYKSIEGGSLSNKIQHEIIWSAVLYCHLMWFVFISQFNGSNVSRNVLTEHHNSNTFCLRISYF